MVTLVEDNQVKPDLAKAGDIITTSITSSTFTITDDGKGNLSISAPPPPPPVDEFGIGLNLSNYISDNGVWLNDASNLRVAISNLSETGVLFAEDVTLIHRGLGIGRDTIKVRIMGGVLAGNPSGIRAATKTATGNIFVSTSLDTFPASVGNFVGFFTVIFNVPKNPEQLLKEFLFYTVPGFDAEILIQSIEVLL